MLKKVSKRLDGSTNMFEDEKNLILTLKPLKGMINEIFLIFQNCPFISLFLHISEMTQHKVHY
jgi:hypothetical protein